MKNIKLILIDFMKEGPVQEYDLNFEGLIFSVTTHQIGWNIEIAQTLIQSYDGYADGFCLSGIQRRLSVGDTKFMHPAYLKLIRFATKTPVYVADEIRDLFAEWTLRKILADEPNFFSGRKVLFLGAVINPMLKTVEEAGAAVSAADALILGGIPYLLKGRKQIEPFLKILKRTVGIFEAISKRKKGSLFKKELNKKLGEWIGQHDIFITFGALLDKLGSYESFKGKTVLTDYLSETTRIRLQQAEVGQVVELTPSHPVIQQMPYKHFSLLTALIDQIRISRDNDQPFDEFVLQWIQELNFEPNRLSNRNTGPIRCAFVIHPLSARDLLKAPGLALLKKAPPFLAQQVENFAAKMPVFYYGSLTGAKSKTTGQEVICDLYAMTATPYLLKKMPEEFVYQRMVEAATLAKSRGAAMMGLGAYTKVIGDAGLTISRRAPIPVTNGNSYSASTTLWAAKDMVEKIGLATPGHLKAMVVGATGSIGRVSSLLISLVVNELILVATRADKLLELREEIKKFSPKVKVRVCTNPHPEIDSADLIVTATSSSARSAEPLFDIERLKPGAVICDCSRPLDITPEQAAKRPDIMVIESGEVLLPGDVQINCDIGLPKPSVYACLAETVLLAMENRFESFSLGKQLSTEKVKEIYKLGVKHGARLSEVRGPFGVISAEQIDECRNLAIEQLKNTALPTGLSNSKTPQTEQKWPKTTSIL